MLSPEFPSSLEIKKDERVDAVVMGGGISGLVTALAAAREGTRVLLIEAGEELGGTFRYSGGVIVATGDFAAMRRHVPEGDPELQRQITDNLIADLTWLHAVPTPMGSLTVAEHFPSHRGLIPTVNTATVSQTTYPAAFATVIGRNIQYAGSLVVVNSAVRMAARIGAHWRVDIEGASGDSWTVLSRAFVACGGGFASSSEHMRRYMQFDPRDVWQRNSGLSVGTGMDIALQNGGQLAGAMDTFYGHNLPAPPARFTRDELLSVSQSYGTYTAAINLLGERFVDESASPPPFEEELAQATARQPGGVVFYVFDQAIYERYVSHRATLGMPTRDHSDKLKAAIEAGGPVWRADSLPELVAAMGDAVASPGTMLGTLATYNAAALAGDSNRMPIGKSGGSEYLVPIVAPPFYAVAVRAGVTLTMGGIKTDSRAAAIDVDGMPIPGLYAAGADIGNIHNRHYIGGNAVGLVFGRIAAKGVSEYARSLNHA